MVERRARASWAQARARAGPGLGLGLTQAASGPGPGPTQAGQGITSLAAGQGRGLVSFKLSPRGHWHDPTRGPGTVTAARQACGLLAWAGPDPTGRNLNLPVIRKNGSTVLPARTCRGVPVASATLEPYDIIHGFNLWIICIWYHIWYHYIIYDKIWYHIHMISYMKWWLWYHILYHIYDGYDIIYYIIYMMSYTHFICQWI